MPTLTLRPTERCAVCGFRVRGFCIGSYRINKNSLVAAVGTLQWVEPQCSECGHPQWPTSDRFQLEPESQAVVDAHRRKKGWDAA